MDAISTMLDTRLNTVIYTPLIRLISEMDVSDYIRCDDARRPTVVNIWPTVSSGRTSHQFASHHSSSETSDFRREAEGRQHPALLSAKMAVHVSADPQRTALTLSLNR